MKPLEHNTLLQNRYLVGQMIGKGGMGEVYLAVDQRIGAPVALKRTYFAGDDVLGGGFESEAKALERLRHQSLAKVTDHFFDEGGQFLVMDHVAGDDLAKRLTATQKPFPLSWVMFWADQLLDALVYLHSNEPPIIHRDIKPQNLKLTDDNNIILLDFGLSRRSIAKLEGSGIVESGFAKPYAPLEQIRGTETNRQSDIYSLSASLYFLLTNVVPPDATMRADAVLSGAPDPLVPVNVLNPEVPPTISDVILKGMSVSHDQRFGDVRTMQKSLREAFAAMRDPAGAKTVVMAAAPDAVPTETPVAETTGTVGEVAATKDDMGAQTIPFGMLAADLEPEPAAPSSEPAPDFDSTVRYDGPIIGAPPVPDSVPQQANIKTEVFIKSDYVPETPAPKIPEASAPPIAETRMPDATVPFVSFEGDTSPVPDLSGAAEVPAEPPVPEMISQNFESQVPSAAPTPDGTMPIVNLGGETAPAPSHEFTDSTNFSVPASPVGGGFAETVASGGYPQAAPEPVSSPPVAVAAAPAKTRSKGFLIGILVALFLLMIVGAGGAGLAWYFYSGQGSLFGPSETPTPLATPTPEATPEPTVTPFGSTSDQSSPTPTETPTESPTVTPTETPTTVQPDRPTPTRPTPVPATPRPTRSTVQPTQKPTQKPTVKPTPKLRGREIPQ